MRILSHSEAATWRIVAKRKMRGGVQMRRAVMTMVCAAVLTVLWGCGGAAGANILIDPDLNLAVFYAHHMLNPQEEYYQPRLRNVIYSSI